MLLDNPGISQVNSRDACLRWVAAHACAGREKLASGSQGFSPMTERRSDMGHQDTP